MKRRLLTFHLALAALFTLGPLAEVDLILGCVEASHGAGAGSPFWLMLKPRRLCARLRTGLGEQPLNGNGEWRRGLPAHRWYLEQFLREHAGDIRGRCLEFEDDHYATRFGGSAITNLDILHIDSDNPRATIVCDLSKPNPVPDQAFDCIICTHVLHVIPDFRSAIQQMHRILRPGGTLLVASGCATPIVPWAGELWRFTPLGLKAALEESFGQGAVAIHAYGNSVVAAGDLRGLAADDFSAHELAMCDERFPVEVCARATRAAMKFSSTVIDGVNGGLDRSTIDGVPTPTLSVSVPSSPANSQDSLLGCHRGSESLDRPNS